MKIIIRTILMVVLSLSAVSVNAQEKIFNHLSLGAELGTTGWGFEIASPITHYITVRTGFTTLPRFNINTDVNYTTQGEEKNVDIRGRVHMSDFKLLADIYPFKHSSFHITGGFYEGMKNLGTVHNTSPLEVAPGEGMDIGGVFIRPDADNQLRLHLQTKGFKPYVGLGFGRPISSKHKVSAAFDLGVMFWGKPKLKVYSPDENTWVQIRKRDVHDDDLYDAMDKIEKVSVYPVLNFRIYYNMF